MSPQDLPEAVPVLVVGGSLGEGDGALVEQDFGISDKGASLVRPDGVVAWRSVEGDGTVEALGRAMKLVAHPAKARK